MTKRQRWAYPAIIAGTYFLIMCLFSLEALLTPSLKYAFSFVGYGGTFQYSSIKVGTTSISLYWLMHGVGVFSMIWMCLLRAKSFQLNRILAVITVLLLAIFGFIGAKLLYIVENWNSVQKNGLSFGGVSFFGTVFFMPLIIPLMALAFRKKPMEFLDYCTPSGIIMLTCIRTGCFFRGCCHGITLWVNSRPVILPSQLLECTLDMLLLSMIFFVERQGKMKGKLYALFMGGYGVLRFIVEFTRDTPKDIFGLSHGQCFSLLCILICILVVFRKPSKKEGMIS